MPYPIITPAYFQDLTSEEKGTPVDHVVLTTPSTIEYVFPLYEERLVRTLMETKEPLSYKMANLKPEHEKEFAEKGAALVEQFPNLKNYWNFKILTMNILQNRKYVFEKRMLLLNYAYKTLQGIIEKAKPEERDEVIDKFMNEFMGASDHDSVIEFFKSITPNFAYSLCDGLSFLRSLPESDEYTTVLGVVFANVGCDYTLNEFRFNREIYLPVKRAYHEEFLKDREHYIEQIMVNYAWTYCMPYADMTMGLWENFIFFNTLFNAVKILITGAVYEAADPDGAFVKAITEFDLALRRAKGGLIQAIVDANKKEGLSNNGDMAILSMS